MNRIILLFTFLTFTTVSLIAQSDAYVPMFGKNTSGWYQYADLSEAGGKTTLKMYSDGDTTVNGKTYIRLMNDWYFASEDTTHVSVVGFYREDVSERKVYSLNSPSSIEPENVYYDFSKQTGDTLRIGTNVVLKLDSINTALVVCGDTIDTNSRVFHFTNTSDDSPVTWVEGVGSLAGIQANYYSIDCGSLDEALVCKMTDDNIVYHFNQIEGFEECAFDVSSSIHQKPEELTLRLYPNPTHSSLHISGNPAELGNARYRIFNLTGKNMQTGFLEYSRETTLDVSRFQSGAYILEIYNAEKNLLTNKKFVIAN